MGSFYTIIAGAGPGTGRAAALRFSKTYPVVMLARRPESYEDIVRDIRQAGGQALGIVADVADSASLSRAFDIVGEALPNLKLAAAVYNVNSGFMMKPFLELQLDEFQNSFGKTGDAFFNFTQKTLPLLREAVKDSPHPPTLITTGATASIKASAGFAAFSAGRFAMRALNQSLAREFGPQGVHIAHVVIDGLIDTPASKAWSKTDVPDSKIQPDAIAETYWHLHIQPRSAFTQEMDIRPFSERF
ncbi:uncharacterized protein NECHADRAFT_90417 [Fusarium vanettenii 77-13-4]|uniref:Short chain dehydrogenase n=1 Tax=Fusarium vanettenii (strain ATCC MYA-4622 / CBS 123669 / FGSC 9596 / NRRL 45880 / 77-13-4) TaxID=660122 RepID=C7YIR5_FUSV7|nr:uncharacterized protein NECHADRAFT_90417 [Fusarium vanettenii 77-13-4]EEU48141.1 hypothetical protein NECHADRAFT_90417 [Fusarium vanettenii 77-13-4]